MGSDRSKYTWNIYIYHLAHIKPASTLQPSVIFIDCCIWCLELTSLKQEWTNEKHSVTPTRPNLKWPGKAQGIQRRMQRLRSHAKLAGSTKLFSSGFGSGFLTMGPLLTPGRLQAVQGHCLLSLTSPGHTKGCGQRWTLAAERSDSNADYLWGATKTKQTKASQCNPPHHWSPHTGSREGGHLAMTASPSVRGAVAGSCHPIGRTQ